MLAADGDLELNAGRPIVEVEVTNTGDRVVQVASHVHFFEVNRALRFDRAAAFGCRLDIPAGTAVASTRGSWSAVPLVRLGGRAEVYGHNHLTDGPTDDGYRPAALERARGPRLPRGLMARISRRRYAELYGPTTGDLVRLGDSALLAEIEHDHTDLWRGAGGQGRRQRPRRAGRPGDGERVERVTRAS